MSERKRYAMGTVILIAAVALIVCGVVRDEPATVLQKAVRICMECIGIG